MTNKTSLPRDHIANAYFGLWGDELTQEIARRRIDWLSSQVTEGKILDIGCSEGILPILLGRFGFRTIGIDTNPESIEFAESLLSKETQNVKRNVEFICSDIFKLAKSHGKFKTVILGEILEHFENPNLLLKEAKKFLEKNGTLLVTTPYGFFPDPDHKYTFTLESFLGLFQSDFIPQHLSIIDGYIRFIGKYSQPKKTDWDKFLSEKILHILEESYIQDQKLFRSRISEINQTKNEANQKYKKITEQLNRTKKQAESQIKSLNEDNKITKREIKLLKEERLSAERQIKLLEDEKASAEHQIKLLEEEKVSAERQIKLLEDEKASAEHQIKLLEEGKVSAERQIKLLEEDKNNLEIKFKDSRKQRDLLQEKLTNALNNYDNVKGKYNQLLGFYRNIKESIIYKIIEGIQFVINNPKRNLILFPYLSVRFIYREIKRRQNSRHPFDSESIVQEFDVQVSSIEEQERSFQESLRSFISFTQKQLSVPVIVISTGTKRMGVMKRLNRTMAFASELTKMKIPVIYVYYRFRKTEDFPSDYDGGYLLQLPNDIFHRNSELIAEKITNQNRVFICSIPDMHAVNEIDLFKLYEWETIYEVRDDWEEFHSAGVGRWYAPQYERYLCKKADVITTVSIFLKDKMVDFGAKPDATKVIPNGLKSEFYQMAKSEFNRKRSGGQGNGAIGYFGHLTEKWFNWNLLISAAKKSPRSKFEIIGFGEPADLKLPENIKFLGEKSHEEIIEIAKDWSVAIIPFKQSKLARAVDPIKIYEYLSLGIPCVSCHMDQIEDYPYTFIYSNDSQFMKTIKRALDCRLSPEEWQSIEGFLEKSTWKARVMETLSLVGVSLD